MSKESHNLLPGNSTYTLFVQEAMNREVEVVLQKKFVPIVSSVPHAPVDFPAASLCLPFYVDAVVFYTLSEFFPCNLAIAPFSLFPDCHPSSKTSISKQVFSHERAIFKVKGSFSISVVE